MNRSPFARRSRARPGIFGTTRFSVGQRWREFLRAAVGQPAFRDVDRCSEVSQRAPHIHMRDRTQAGEVSAAGPVDVADPLEQTQDFHNPLGPGVWRRSTDPDTLERDFEDGMCSYVPAPDRSERLA